MKRLFILLVLLATPVWATSVTIDVPDAVASNASDLCETLRIQMRVRASTWSVKVCAEELLRRGLRSTLREQIVSDGRAQINDDITTQRDVFDNIFPAYEARTGRELPPMRMICGDGVLDNDVTIPYVEECDDGNTVGGDGCSESCVIE
jgi:cysteine-rich repeat protein